MNRLRSISCCCLLKKMLLITTNLSKPESASEFVVCIYSNIVTGIFMKPGVEEVLQENAYANNEGIR